MDKIAIMNKARAKYRLEHEEEIKRQAMSLFEQYKNDPLFIAGIMLYWAEGKATQRDPWSLELSNANPELLKLYRRFLTQYLKVDNAKLRARLFLYPDLDESDNKVFWSNLLDVPLAQFNKSYIGNSRSSVTKHKLAHGDVCSLYIARKDLRMIISIWIDQFAGFCIKGKV